MRAVGKRRSLMAGTRQSALEFLPPMCHISGWPVTVDHAHRRGLGIRELMEHAWRDVDSLSSVDHGSLVSEAHLALSLNDEVDLFLVLVVPGHLPAVWIERDVSERKIGGLDGA